MKEMYNGAVMALPEKEEDFFAQINEVTAMRRREREQHEEDMNRASEALQRKMKSTAPAALPRQDLRKFGGTVARFLLGCVFLGAMARGWCGTEFGLTGAVACGLWAVARWRR